jgi:hypothetical protein
VALIFSSPIERLVAKPEEADGPQEAPPRDEDPEQSKRFIETARAIEADGGLSPIAAADAVDRMLKKATVKAPE